MQELYQARVEEFNQKANQKEKVKVDSRVLFFGIVLAIILLLAIEYLYK